MPHTASAPPTLVEPEIHTRARRIPHWLIVPLGIYALFRLAGAAMLVWASQFQEATRRLEPTVDPRTDYFVHALTPADPGLLGVSTTWDGQWYWSIAELGYRSAAADGSIAAQWAWAFPPGYPKTVAAVMYVSGLPFPAAAILVSLVAGAVASVLVYRLAQHYVGPMGAAGLVAVTNGFVTAPLLQVAYSESLALALLVWALLCLRSDKYSWACIPVTALGFVRVVTPPLAVVALVIILYRWRESGRRPHRTQLFALATFCTVCLLSAFSWSTLAGLLTNGDLANRPLVMLELAPLGWFGWWATNLPLGFVLLVLAVASLGMVAWRMRHEWGPEMSTWAFVYPVFVLGVTPISSGILRYMLLAFPIGLLFVGRRETSHAKRAALLTLACLIGLSAQVLWVRYGLLADTTGGRPLIP